MRIAINGASAEEFSSRGTLGKILRVYIKNSYPRRLVSTWSSGMIAASGVAGRGFNSPSGPTFCFFY